MKKFSIKPKIYFNEGSMEFLKEIRGSCAFILSDAVMDKLGYLQKAVDYLESAQIRYEVFTDVKPEPDVLAVTTALEKYMATEADTIIALGGGSAMDTVKAMLYFLKKAMLAAGKPFHKPLFIAIPTTSGTGSEVTDFSVITVNGSKVALIDDLMTPDIAILDSTCIRHVPPQVIADTGIDALVHAIEAYVSTESTDCTDALAEKAVQIIFQNLEELYRNADNKLARERIQRASCLAGMAFTNTNLGINHSLAHALGATFHLSHGRSNGLVLTSVLEYNAGTPGRYDTTAAAKYASLAAVLGLPARTVREGNVNFLQAVQSLKRSIGIPDHIRSAGVDPQQFEAALDKMAALALADRCTPTNPRKPSKEDIIAMYQRSY
jgi:alcohol dehydrogenase class IV